MRTALALVALCSTWGIGPVAAQPTSGAAVSTAGVVLPHADVAAGDHAEAMEVNPAGLGFGTAFQLSYTYLGSESKDPNHGHAILTSLSLGERLALGYGYQLVLPDTEDDTVRKSTWASAIRLSPRLSLGLSWHSFEGGSLDGMETYDLGLQLRPIRWLSMGLTVQDLEGPDADSSLLRRSWLSGIAVRPGTEDITLSGRARIFEEADRDTEWGGTLQMRLYGRIGLLARYDRQSHDGEAHHRVMVGLSDWGAAGGGLFFSSPDVGDPDSRSGVAIAGRIRSKGPETPRILKRPLVAEVVVRNTTEYAADGLFTQQGKAPFLQLLRTLRHIERHQDVSAVILSFATSSFGWGQAAELREAIERIRAAGKKVYAWVPVANTRVYSVAAAADTVYTNTAGGLLLTGMRSQIRNLGVMLRRLGVKAQFIAAGDFKSAPELFTRDTPSDAAKRVENALLDDLYGRVVGHIARGRGVTPIEARAWIDNGPYGAAESKTVGLTDGVIHYDEFEGILKQDFGPRTRFVNAKQLMNFRADRWGGDPEIAVLYAAGTIADGESVSNSLLSNAVTGADTFARAAERLRKDGNVKAVVLRVDSPGGSVTAAERMWRAMERLAKAKPVVVSFGDIAASGGYYIAGPGREILAMPETITGSIGVFMGKFNLKGLYEGLGIKNTLFLRGQNAAIRSDVSDWSQSEIARAQKSTDTLYDLFLDRVDAGRKSLSKAQIEPLAGGRVWTGAQASACGLVDRHAGLMTALDLAAQTASVGDGEYAVGVYPRRGGGGSGPRSPFGQMRAALGDWLVSPAINTPTGLEPFLAAVRPLLTLPVLHFGDGTPLALLPFVWE